MEKNKFFAFILILYVVLSCMYCSSGIKVKIKNKSDRPILNIKVIYSGGHNIIKHLNVADTSEFIMYPKGESTVNVEYEDSINEKYDCFIGIYLETGYSGSLDITIGEGGKMSYKFVHKYLLIRNSIFEKDIQCIKKEG
jgi:hypothetical protein